MAHSAHDLARLPEFDDEVSHCLVAGAIKDNPMAAGNEEGIVAVDAADARQGCTAGACLLCVVCVTLSMMS